MTNDFALRDVMIMVAAVIIILLILWIVSKVQKKQPVLTIPATVIMKCSKADWTNFTPFRFTHNAVVIVDANNQKHHFKLNDALFTQIPCLQKGILTYQGNRFIQFESETVIYK